MSEREQIDKLKHKIASCMQRDQFRLRQELGKFESSQGHDKCAFQEIENRVQSSIEKVNSRRQMMPSPELDPELPISQRRDEIADAIMNHQVVVISGETGSGKSTQLPLIALQLGIGSRGLIGHTQPRRIAARSVANRVASQLNSSVGKSVGFKIRFDDKTTDDTYVKLMTDGILLAETQSDRFLDQYEMIIIDEAHERSLNIDFLIGTLKRTLTKRKDLKVVITSATIDTERFANHFVDSNGLPALVINVEGRTYPVETRYEPFDEARNENESFVDHVVEVTQQMAREEHGDLLVFLPTENDIKTVNKKLRSARFGGNAVDILPLYARLSNEQQNTIFQPGSRRRIVLATNVAESSITVPGIRVVIDSGTARISRYAPRSKVQRLPIEPISQASANQRAGRCGRVGPGICMRLYSEEDFLSRPNFTTPEIRRTNLASVILQTLALRLGDINEFPFLDPPHAEAISDGYKTLFEIGAIDEKRKLTKLGRWLAKLPVDPRIGRMLHSASENGCLNEVLVIASALEIQDPRIRPAEKQKQADEQHEKFRHEKSDFMSYLKLWDFFHQLRRDLSKSKYRLACKQNFLSLPMIHQWQEVHRQLKNVVRQQGLKLSDRKDEYNAIHRSLLAGLLSGIATVAERHEYLGPGGVKFHLWPGSGVFEAKPKWIVVAEIVETSRRYGRTVAKIAPEWIEPISNHLAKRRFVDPFWSKKQQTVMAYENVTLFGLPIVVRRRIGFTKIDPEISRQIFIDQGLTEFQLGHKFNFMESNRNLLEEIEQLAAKSRRREFVIDSGLLYQFYEENIPECCFDVASLRMAIKKSPELDHQLQISKRDLSVDETSVEKEQFPDEVQVGSMRLPVEYRFEPGKVDDGATITIPLDGLSQLDAIQAGWLVPGLNETRIVSMIKSLPKSLRRNLIPAPEVAKRVMGELVPGHGAFTSCVAQQLAMISGQAIVPDMFDQEKIDANLRVNLQVVDENGDVVAQGRDVNSLRASLGGGDSNGIVEIEDPVWNQDGLTTWTWGELPEQVNIQRGVAIVPLFPTVVDQGASVGLRLVSSRELSGHLMQFGMLRLLVLRLKKTLKRQVNWLPDLAQHTLKLSSVITSEQLRTGLIDGIASIALVQDNPVIRTEQEFDDRVAGSIECVSIATQKIAKWLPRFANDVHQANLQMESLPGQFRDVVDGIKEQIQTLTHERFLVETSWSWLEHYPRYFAGITARCEKLRSGSLDNDSKCSALVAGYWSQYEGLKSAHRSLSIFDSELTKFRWMIEEFRVAQFAQKLGTCITVSEKRLQKQLQLIQKP